MKKILLLVIMISLSLFSQEKPNDFSKKIYVECISWCAHFTNFELADFEQIHQTKFSDLAPINTSFDQLESVYKKTGYFSKDKSKFIEPYSSFGLEKKGKYYVTNAEPDQYIDLYFLKKKKQIRLLTFGTSAGIDDVIWANDTNVILLGKSYEDETPRPIIIIIDITKETITHFGNTKAKIKGTKRYISKKLKSVGVKEN